MLLFTISDHDVHLSCIFLYDNVPESCRVLSNWYLSQTRRQLDKGGFEKEEVCHDSPTSQVKHQQQASGNGEKPSIAKLFEQGSNDIYCLCLQHDPDIFC